jgi:hypothetical protein
MTFPHSVVTARGFWLGVVAGILMLTPRTVVAEWTIGDPPGHCRFPCSPGRRAYCDWTAPESAPSPASLVLD